MIMIILKRKSDYLSKLRGLLQNLRQIVRKQMCLDQWY